MRNGFKTFLSRGNVVDLNDGDVVLDGLDRSISKWR